MKDKYQEKRLEYLKRYYKKYNMNFKVQKWDTGPYDWLNYGTPEYKKFLEKEKWINNREIFPDEIVTDIDSHEDTTELQQRKATLELRDIIINRLNTLYNMNYTCWPSGGTGHHFHSFCPELLNYSAMDRRLIKREFRKMLGLGYLRKNKNKANVCHGATLIQCEYAPHRKGGYKVFFCENTQGTNKIPKAVLKKFREEKKKYSKKYIKKLNGKDDIPKCIKYLETEDFANIKDGEHRALFALACTYSHLLEEKELIQHLREWNRKRLGKRLFDKEIRATARSVKIRKYPIPYNYIKELLDDMNVKMDFSDCER